MFYSTLVLCLYYLGWGGVTSELLAKYLNLHRCDISTKKLIFAHQIQFLSFSQALKGAGALNVSSQN